jgi:hypothetical protein
VQLEADEAEVSQISKADKAMTTKTVDFQHQDQGKIQPDSR